MNKKYRLEGSMTVEAAFVIPSILCVYLFIVYSAFYYHDYIQTQQYAKLMTQHLIKSCLKNIDLQEKYVDYEKECEDRLIDSWKKYADENKAYVCEAGKRDIQQRLLVSRIDHIKLDCGYNYLTKKMWCKIETYGCMNFPIKLFGIKKASIHVEDKSEVLDTVRWLWDYREKKLSKG